MNAALLADVFSGLSVLAASVYGFALLIQPVGGPRTLVKAAAVGLIGLVSMALGGPWLLTAALLVAAAGDAFLAGEPRPWLPFGLAASLLVHLLYIVLFAQHGLGLLSLARYPRWLIAAGAVGLAGAVLRALWSELGRLRVAGGIYLTVIAAMVVMACVLPWSYAAAIIGAVLFMISGAILAFRLFHGGRPNLAADLAVWWFRWAAQALIARAFLHPA